MKSLKETLKTIKATRLHMMIMLIALVWCDMGITYMLLYRTQALNSDYISVTELSLTANPAIQKLGLERGLLIAGIINSLLIVVMTMIFPLEYLFGVISGVLFMACYLNIKAMSMLSLIT